MIYVVQVYEKGNVIKDFEVEGLDKAQRLRDYYESEGYDTELNPHVYAYLKKYGPAGAPPTSTLA